MNELNEDEKSIPSKYFRAPARRQDKRTGFIADPTVPSFARERSSLVVPHYPIIRKLMNEFPERVYEDEAGRLYMPAPESHYELFPEFAESRDVIWYVLLPISITRREKRQEFPLESGDPNNAFVLIENKSTHRVLRLHASSFHAYPGRAVALLVIRNIQVL
jgi:hypothetical protein